MTKRNVCEHHTGPTHDGPVYTDPSNNLTYYDRLCDKCGRVRGKVLVRKDRPCVVCGIMATYLPIPKVWVHATPRDLSNDLHNGTPDHNAVVKHKIV